MRTREGGTGRAREDEAGRVSEESADTVTVGAVTGEVGIRRADGGRGTSLERMMHRMARGALLGARGNSGVIVSQILRGMADAFATTVSVRGSELAQALRKASEAAYAAVARPVEGTVLSVVAAAADGASRIKSDDLLAVARAAALSAREALARTPQQLPVLARAGVVDAGGRGLVLLLDALVEALTTDRDPAQPVTATAHLPAPAHPATDSAHPPAHPASPAELSTSAHLAGPAPSTDRAQLSGSAHRAGPGQLSMPARPEVPPAQAAMSAPPGAIPGRSAATGQLGSGAAKRFGAAGPPEAHRESYEVQYLLDAAGEAVDGLRNLLDSLGDSLVIVGTGDGVPPTWNVHVHVDVRNIGAAIEAGIEAGRPHRISVTPLTPAAEGSTPGAHGSTHDADGGTHAADGRTHAADGRTHAGHGSGAAGHAGHGSNAPALDSAHAHESTAAGRGTVDAVPGSTDVARASAPVSRSTDAGSVEAATPSTAHADRGGSAPAPPYREGGRASGTRERGAVVVASGDGLTELFAGEGAVVVGNNPSIAEMLAAIDLSGAGEVVLLPNDANTHEVARAAAKEAAVHVRVVPTRSPVQALAALAVRDPQRRFDEDVIAMAEAAGACRHGELTTAAREALTVAGRCRPGELLGLVDGEVHVIGADWEDVCRQLLDRMLGGGGELVTIVLGADAPPALESMLRAHVAQAWPFVELQCYAGGQPRYHLLVGVE